MGNENIIRHENDVRAMVARSLDNVRWIEPNTGSTLGLPDGFVVLGSGMVLWLELKRAKPVGRLWKISFTPAQKRELPRMQAEGALINVVVGMTGVQGLWQTALQNLVARSEASGWCFLEEASKVGFWHKWPMIHGEFGKTNGMG